MANVLRTHKMKSEDLIKKVHEEIVLLTNGVPCRDCVEILFESDLYRRLMAEADYNDNALDFKSATPSQPATVLGFKYRVVYGPGVRYGSLTVITRTEVVFK